MSKRQPWLPVVAVLALVTACASHKEPALQAVADAETSLNALREDAQRFAPQELRRADAGLLTLQTFLEKGEYKAVVDVAPAVSTQIASLSRQVAEGKAQAQSAATAAMGQWQALSTQAAQVVAALEARIAELQGRASLPQGLTPQALQSAVDDLAVLKSAWTEAMAMYGAGNAPDAVAKAQAVLEKGRELGRQLGISP